jgi:hypothetical protein
MSNLALYYRIAILTNLKRLVKRFLHRLNQLAELIMSLP